MKSRQQNFIKNILGTIIAEKMNMKKKIKRSKLVKVLRTLKIDSIAPFKEKPSDLINKDKKNEMDASELFSFFTADIIKEDVEFVR